ncbi:MAG: hypothetical protein JWN92_1732 [Candidatus Acidoferrum typicum]|nr:hypothetical protein [Candidatus Acidoferrum typicum]
MTGCGLYFVYPEFRRGARQNIVWWNQNVERSVVQVFSDKPFLTCK